MPEKHHVVVDGSNLATEGRTLPSLAQLDEAVRTYAEEDPTAEIVVVVDATFEHRIDPSEREQYEQAELHGEVVSPPAGAIGRGDAFVLRIAERTGAIVLSNDSFQEFHGEHPWLFEEGRLVGGKPVPGVGWIFTPRSPVRGPKSRQATGKARRDAERIESGADLPAPVKAAELAKAAKKVAKAAKRAPKHADGTTPKIGDVWEEPAPGRATAPAKKAKRAAKATKTTKKATKVAEPKKVAKKVAKAAAPAPLKVVKTTAKKAKKAPSATKAATRVASPLDVLDEPTDVAPPVLAAVEPAATEEGSGGDVAADGKGTGRSAGAGAAVPATPTARRRRGAAVADPEIAEAIGAATAEALAPPKETKAKAKAEPKRKAKSKSDHDTKHDDKKGFKRRGSATPPPAVNEPLAFITFVATYPIGSEVEGEVVSFTSHGAMIEVTLPDGTGVHCYVPLSGLGNPAPRKAREVIARGERRHFVLVGLDPPRRVAELALPGVQSATAS
jgi:hypothetical protein